MSCAKSFRATFLRSPHSTDGLDPAVVWGRDDQMSWPGGGQATPVADGEGRDATPCPLTAPNRLHTDGRVIRYRIAPNRLRVRWLSASRIPEVVGNHAQLQPDLIRPEPVTREPRPVRRLLAFLRSMAPPYRACGRTARRRDSGAGHSSRWSRRARTAHRRGARLMPRPVASLQCREHSIRTAYGDVLFLIWWKDEDMLITLEGFKARRCCHDRTHRRRLG